MKMQPISSTWQSIAREQYGPDLSRPPLPYCKACQTSTLLSNLPDIYYVSTTHVPLFYGAPQQLFGDVRGVSAHSQPFPWGPGYYLDHRLSLEPSA